MNPRIENFEVEISDKTYYIDAEAGIDNDSFDHGFGTEYMDDHLVDIEITNWYYETDDGEIVTMTSATTLARQLMGVWAMNLENDPSYDLICDALMEVHIFNKREEELDRQLSAMGLD